jgi:hypothetical protein
MTGFVYAIESGDAVKIGWARDPRKRLSELNVGSPTEHKLLGFIEGTQARERELHSEFRHHRIRGEWFRKAGPVLEFVANLPPVPAHSKARRSARHSGDRIIKWTPLQDGSCIALCYFDGVYQQKHFDAESMEFLIGAISIIRANPHVGRISRKNV